MPRANVPIMSVSKSKNGRDELQMASISTSTSSLVVSRLLSKSKRQSIVAHAKLVNHPSPKLAFILNFPFPHRFNGCKFQALGTELVLRSEHEWVWQFRTEQQSFFWNLRESASTLRPTECNVSDFTLKTTKPLMTRWGRRAVAATI